MRRWRVWMRIECFECGRHHKVTRGGPPLHPVRVWLLMLSDRLGTLHTMPRHAAHFFRLSRR